MKLNADSNQSLALLIATLEFGSLNWSLCYDVEILSTLHFVLLLQRTCFKVQEMAQKLRKGTSFPWAMHSLGSRGGASWSSSLLLWNLLFVSPECSRVRRGKCIGKQKGCFMSPSIWSWGLNILTWGLRSADTPLLTMNWGTCPEQSCSASHLQDILQIQMPKPWLTFCSSKTGFQVRWTGSTLRFERIQLEGDICTHRLGRQEIHKKDFAFEHQVLSLLLLTLL